MAVHDGRVAATGERSYAIGRCGGALTVDADRLTVQGEPHANGRIRTPTVIDRADGGILQLRCGLFGATLTWENAAGYRNHLIRVRDPAPLAADLTTHAWPLELAGWRRPRP